MSARVRTVAALLAAASLTAALAACAAQNSPPAGADPTASVEVDVDLPELDAPELDDTPDCDTEDRNKHEQPDCGMRVGETFVEWSWVRNGLKRPPPGWNRSQEAAAIRKAGAPAATLNRAPPPSAGANKPTPTKTNKKPAAEPTTKKTRR